MDGGSVAGVLFIVFLVLKLTHTIRWSWWWVFSPIWIDVVASAILIGVLALFGISVFGVVKRVFSGPKTRALF